MVWHFCFSRLKGTGGSALGGASSALVGTSGNLGAAAAAAVLSGGSSRVTSSGVELRELRRHNYKASVSVLSHLNKGNAASPYVSIGGGHRQRTRAHRAMNMGQKISSEFNNIRNGAVVGIIKDKELCWHLLRKQQLTAQPSNSNP